MKPQSNFMVLAPVAEGREDELRSLLGSMNVRPGMVDPHNALVPFGKFERLHFARFVIVEALTATDITVYGLPVANWPVALAFLGDCDGPADTFLAELVARAGPGLCRIFAFCRGFSPEGDLLEWMVRHEHPPAASYVNWIGRTVLQIREEAALRRILIDRLQQLQNDGGRRSPRELHEQLSAFVAAERKAGHLTLTPESPTPFDWQLRNLLHKIGVPIALLVLAPFLLIASPVLLYLLRRHEITDPDIDPRPDPDHVARLAALEDHDVTNQFTVFGDLKPGRFRRWTTSFLLWILDYSARHIYNRGYLSRVQTIHFARWVFVDDKKRLLFASNYDGSLESYMDDFINKVAWGINLVFSNGMGYPRTNWLIKDGARDEQKYKGVLRRHQLPTEVWYNANPGLTAVDLARNTRIREGIERPAMTEREAREWLSLLTGGTDVAPPDPGLDFGDVQGLIRFGHGRLTDASFFLLKVVDRAAAQRWLQSASVTSARTLDPRPNSALQVAFTRQGLEALGVSSAVIEGFSDEFQGGLAGEESRSRRLGDVGANAPSGWEWGGHGADDVPHLLAMVYALPGGLEAFESTIKSADWHAAFDVQRRLSTFDLGAVEAFGFADGLSQPRLDWERTLAPTVKERPAYSNVIALGEVLLGYPNEYGRYTRRPLIDPLRDPRASDLPAAEDVPNRRDLGRNGTYLVFRQLEQDVRGFWQFLDRQADSVASERWRLAEAMVGRTRSGKPLMPVAEAPIPGVGPDPDDIAANQFTYGRDPGGARCPLGAHVRRANPRSGDLPEGTTGPLMRLLRIFGFKRGSFYDDLIASARFHRIVRRGREYGTPLRPEDALEPGPGNEQRGLHFIGLVANLSRQFEFVQNAWIQGTKFAGLAEERDPLLGSRVLVPGLQDSSSVGAAYAGLAEDPAPLPDDLPSFAGASDDVFTIRGPDGSVRRLTGLPQFVTVRGGAYFFLPGLRALRYIAGAPATGPAPRPAPTSIEENRWRLLRALHRALVIGLHVERRLEPFFRPALNAVLRAPSAALIQYLINRRRPNEGLGLAEERIAPDEEASLESIIDSFAGYLRRTYWRGGYERGGNTKTHGVVRADVTIRDDLPAHLRHGIFAKPRTFPAYVRYSGPGPNLPNDIEDVGFVSMAIKLMDVPGPKLLEDEKFTQDLLAVCTPTFVTPNTRENAKLQIWSFRDMPVFYFLNPLDSHVLDFFMQSWWNETQYNPLGARYWSCVPYLLGEGQAMMYSFYPKSKVITHIPGAPFGRVPPNYLHDNMVATLAKQDVEFDILIQVQTDPHRMPIENASVRWPERMSPFIPAATVHIPRQKFDWPAQIEFAKRLSMNPWHCAPEHRPLGNQSRARLRMYTELSRLRQDMNQAPHIEPTGGERFDQPLEQPEPLASTSG
jgi:deferrochelatase/peroxidase EfeB